MAQEKKEILNIIKRCKKNDRAAQTELYNQYSSVMFAVCLRYSDNYADAQDVFQEAFVKAFQKIKQYNGEGSFEGWLRRLMVNKCMDNFRKKRLTIISESPNDLANEFYEEEEEVSDYETNELVELIQKLPAQYRLVFNLYVVEEYSHSEIAEELNISVGTSKSNLSRAKAWIRKELKRMGNEKNFTVNGYS